MRTSFVEGLERRVLLATTVAQVGDRLLVSGDGAPDVVDVRDDGLGGMTVTCNGLPSQSFRDIATVQVATGGGDDQVNYARVPAVAPTASIVFEADLGEGDDIIWCALSSILGPATPSVQITAYGGTGNDQFFSTTPYTLETTFGISIDGGLGDDVVGLDLGAAGRDTALVGTSTLEVLGGEGVDDIEINVWNVSVLADSSLNVEVDPGAGVDQIDFSHIGGKVHRLGQLGIIVVDGGPEPDVIDVTIGDLTRPTEIEGTATVDVMGGGGGDDVGIIIQNGTILGGGSLDVNVDAGSGADEVGIIVIDGKVHQLGQLGIIVVDGGPEPDVIDVTIGDLARTTEFEGSVTVDVMGGGGNDNVGIILQNVGVFGSGLLAIEAIPNDGDDIVDFDIRDVSGDFGNSVILSAIAGAGDDTGNIRTSFAGLAATESENAETDTPIVVFDSGDGDDTLTVVGASRARLVGDLTFGAISVGPGGGVLVDPTNPNIVLRTQTLAIDPAAFLDVSGNLIIDYTGATPLDSLRGWLTSGYNNGAWNGHGIRSTAAAAMSGTALGYGEAASLFSSFPAIFAGQAVDDTSVLARFTLTGDTNLDRTVDIDDFAKLAANFNQSPRDWTDGDFTYDRLVNIADFSLLAAKFNSSLGRPRAGPVDAIEGLSSAGSRGADTVRELFSSGEGQAEHPS